MRRASILVPLLFLVLGLLAWLAMSGGVPGVGDAGRSDVAAAGGGGADGAVDEAARGRVRAPEQDVRPGRVDRLPGNAFQRAFPELGQDLPQDPGLAAIAGRVMVTRAVPAGGGVLEAAVGERLVARVHVPADGRFLLKNVQPGSGYALVARHDGHAPGGMDRLGVAGAGDTAADTLIDLLVYLVKYRLWLTDHGASDMRGDLYSPFGEDEVVGVNRLLDLAKERAARRGSTAFVVNQFETLSSMAQRDQEAKNPSSRAHLVDQMIAHAYPLAEDLWLKESGTGSVKHLRSGYGND